MDLNNVHLNLSSFLKKKGEAEKEKKINEQRMEMKLIEEKKHALAIKFQPALEKSKQI